jgi:beta-lactamase class D
MTTRLLDTGLSPGGWHLYGKSGSAVLASPGKSDDKRPRIGWFVGWAEKDGRTVLFARLVRFDERPAIAAGPTAKDSVIAELFATPGSL